jgi:hypothetical protein
MSPAQHYAAATDLIGDAMRKIDSMQELTVADYQWGAEHFTRVATVHAILATVPQAQYDAWKREAEAKQRAKHGQHPAASDQTGTVVHPGLMADCADPVCVAAVGVWSQRAETAGPGQVCGAHGNQADRCLLCHIGQSPSLVCTSCGVPCWPNRFRRGDRCDWHGCDGTLVARP